MAEGGGMALLEEDLVGRSSRSVAQAYSGDIRGGGDSSNIMVWYIEAWGGSSSKLWGDEARIYPMGTGWQGGSTDHWSSVSRSHCSNGCRTTQKPSSRRVLPPPNPSSSSQYLLGIPIAASRCMATNEEARRRWWRGRQPAGANRSRIRRALGASLLARRRGPFVTNPSTSRLLEGRGVSVSVINAETWDMMPSLAAALYVIEDFYGMIQICKWCSTRCCWLPATHGR
uniref:Uncharacterized protein n=1 Tax=Oryza nivara TaxID=4536 RepID=A0A0E0HAH3_ORYNI